MINDEYNIKIVHYKDFDEVQYFRNSVICRDDLLIDEDGVISKKEKKEKIKYFTDSKNIILVFYLSTDEISRRKHIPVKSHSNFKCRQHTTI